MKRLYNGLYLIPLILVSVFFLIPAGWPGGQDGVTFIGGLAAAIIIICPVTSVVGLIQILISIRERKNILGPMIGTLVAATPGIVFWIKVTPNTSQ